MTARSLRADLPYRAAPDEQEGVEATAGALPLPLSEPLSEPLPEPLPLKPVAVDVGLVVNTPAIATAQARAPNTADDQPYATGVALDATQGQQDAKQLAQLLYEMLVQLHTPAGVQDAIDQDTWNLLTRYDVLQGAVNSIEYYSNIGGFVCEAELTQPHGGAALLGAKARLQTLQAEGSLPGLAVGMTWRSGYIRLARLGERPVLLLPSILETEPSSRAVPTDAE